ncbi:MAG: hypothetical protein ACK5QS_16070 [Pseudanabaenaceae cyanobacterium]
MAKGQVSQYFASTLCLDTLPRRDWLSQYFDFQGFAISESFALLSLTIHLPTP